MRWLRYALSLLVWVLLAALSLLVSAWAHAGLPVAKRAARDLVNQLASGELRGSLLVGRFDELSSERVVARHVTLFDGDGRRIVVADRLVLVPEQGLLLRLVQGTSVLRFHEASLHRGTVRLVDSGDGLPTLFTAFDAASPSVVDPSAPTTRIVLERVTLDDVALYGELLGLSGLRANVAAAHGQMEIADEVDVTIRDARGELTEPFGFVGHVDALSGAISTRPEQGVVLHVSGRRDGERAKAQISFKSPSKDAPQELDLLIDAQQVSSDTVVRLGFDWAESFASELSGQLRLHGPIESLRIEGSLHADAGDVRIAGVVSDAEGVKIKIESDNLALDKLVPTAPAVSVRGSMQLDVPTPDASPRLHLELAALRYQGIAIPAIELDGTIESDHLRVERAHTSARGARLSARGTVGWNGNADIDVDAYFPAIERDPNLSRLVDDVRGSLTAKVHVKTPRDSRGILDVNGRIVLTGFVYGSIAADRVTLSGSARGDPSLPTLRVTVLGEGTSVLAYSLGTARFALNGGPRGYQAEGEFQAKGQKTFYFNAKILADRKGFVVQAEPIEFAVGESTWRGVARDVRVVHGDRFELGLLRLASRSQRLESQGIIRIDGEDQVTAQLQDFDLAAVRALLGKSFPFSEGRADATVEVHGDVARPELLLQGAMRGGKVYDVEAVDALYSINYKDGRLDLDAQVDVGERGMLNVLGQADIDPTLATVTEIVERGRYDLALQAERFDLTILPLWQDSLRSGRVSGSLQVEGTLQTPKLSGKLEFVNLTVAEVAPLGITTKLKYEGSAFVGEVSVRDTAGPVGKVSGTLSLDWQAVREDPDAFVDALLSGNWDLSGETSERRLDRLPFPLPADFALPIVVSTRVDLRKRGGPAEGFIRFTAKPTAKLDFDECKLAVMPELRGMLILRNGETSFSFTGHLDGKRMSFGSGAVDLPIERWLHGDPVEAPATFDVQGQLDVDDMSRAPLLCELGRGDMHVKWNAEDLLTDTPHAAFSVNGSYLPRTRVRAGRRLVSIESCGKDDPVRLALDARADPRSVTATGRLSGCRGGPTALQAFLPIVWNRAEPVPAFDDSRESRLSLDFDDAELRPLLDRIPGVLGFSALAKGRLVAKASKERVEYTGQIKLHDGKLYPIATGQEIREITGTLTGNGTWLKLASLTARAGEGSLAVQGGIGLTRWLPSRLQLALVAKKFPVQREGVDLAWLDGSAALSTEIGDERAITAIKLHALSVRLPDANTRSLQPLEPHPDVTLTTEQREIPDVPYVLEFFVDGRRKISVKRDDFDAIVSAELAMAYQDPAFRVGGYVEFQRGTFQVFGKDFRLNRGTLHFDGTGELNPEVNMVATYEPEAAGGSPVVVTVTGTLAEPHIEFFSDSCPGDGAIVMLVSGRCPTEDPNSSGSAQEAQDAFAAGIVGGILTLGAKRELGALIPRFSVESTGQGQQARVKAGFDAVPKFMRSLVQRVYVQGAYSTGQDSALEVDDPNATVTRQLDFLIELYFPHNIVGSGKFSPERYWGLDVTWEP